MREVLFIETLEGMTIERVVRDYEFTMQAKHFHNEYEIYYLLEGERYYFIEKESYYVKKGSIVIIDKDLIHKTSSTSDSYHDRILIELDPEFFDPFFNRGGLSLPEFFRTYTGVIELDKNDQKIVEDILFGIASELKEKNPGYELWCSSKLAELLVYILRRKSASVLSEKKIVQSPKHRKVQVIADYILHNYEEVQSLDELAGRFFVSKFYLSRIFKEITGFTVTEYINIQKIKKAKKLLAVETYNITQISEILGYESITYFEKVFKKYTELNPLKYRKMIYEEKANKEKYP